MKPVNIVLGRFQPYTKGHQACVDAAFEEVGLKTVLCIIETPDNKVDERHPFPTSMLIPWIEKMMHGGSHIQDYVLVKNADIAKIAEALHDKGYELASWTCGTDRYPAYSRQCKGYWEKVGLPEEPKCIEVKRGDDDVSATKAREALKNNDEKAYTKLMTPEWGSSSFATFRHQLLKVVENQNRYNMKPLAEYMENILESSNSRTDESFNFDVNLKRIIKDLTTLVEDYNISMVSSDRGLEIEDNSDKNSKIILPNLVNKKTLNDFMKRMKSMSKPLKVSWNTGKTGYIPTEDDIIGVK